MDVVYEIYKVEKIPGSPPDEPVKSDFSATQNDKTIWKAFKNGNCDAFNFIYTTYFSVLFNYGRQLTADRELIKDCIQDLFIDLRKSGRRLSDTTCIKYYLLKAIRSKIFRYLQIKQKKWPSDPIAEGYNFKLVNSPDVRLIHAQSNLEKKEKLQTLLNELPKRQREAIYHYYYGNLSYQEVANVMRLAGAKSARNLIYKALRELKENKALLTSLLASLLLLLMLLFY